MDHGPWVIQAAWIKQLEPEMTPNAVWEGPGWAISVILYDTWLLENHQNWK